MDSAAGDIITNAIDGWRDVLACGGLRRRSGTAARPHELARKDSTMSTKKTIPTLQPQPPALKLLAVRGSAPIGFMTVLLLAGCWLATGITPAAAASFDCKKATQPLDKRICGDAELSKLDEDLAAAYATAKAALSPDGQKILQTGQHDWLSYSRRICKTRLDPKIAKLVEESVEDCLKGEYRNRTENLAAGVTQAGGFTFSQVDTYQAKEADPTVASGHTGFSYTQMGWPRIDVAPAGIDATPWNKAIAAAANKLATSDTNGTDADDAGNQAGAAPAGSDPATTPSPDQGDQDADDIDISYNFGLITPQMISVELTIAVNGHGAAHPSGGSEVHNVFLADGHDLMAQELFRSDQDWQGYLLKRSHATWLEIMSDAPDMIDDKAIAKVVADPTNWQLTDKGLSLLFPTYSVGPDVVGEQQVDFTWDELKPYLVDKLPFTRP
jgi:uncharacterized protein YecT (DUF1311 family)